MAKKSIKEQVLEGSEILKAFTTTAELRDWAVKNGMDNRSAFPRFKNALLEIGIDYEALKNEASQKRLEDLESKITHSVTLFADAKASKDRFAITDKDGNVLWYGKFFDSDNDYNGEQSSGELASAKKAVWLASKIKEEIGAEAIELNLMVDAQWLIWQDHAGQKGFVLTQLANKFNIKLNVEWIEGTKNPADRWTTETGFKKWSDNDLKSLAVELKTV